MKLQAKTYDLESSGADLAEEFGMETTDPAVIQIMLENIYPDPYVWPRELLANWIDAGGGGSLTLPEAIDPLWVIEDHGEGMDHEFMMKKYTKIFASNKRDSNEKIGGFGHGRLSPLAYTDTYNVRSRFMHEGEIWEGNYVVFRGENRIPKILNTSLALSEVQQTGVTVTIPIGTRDIARINERTRFFASYLDTQPEGFTKVQYKYMNAYGGHRENDNNEMRGVRLILGGVPYPVPRELRLADNMDVDIFFALGELQPTLARDAINADEATQELIKNRFRSFTEGYSEKISKELEAEPSVLDRYFKWLKTVNDLPYGLRNYLTIKNAGATLSGEEIFTNIKGNFNVHDVTSDIDNHRYNGMSAADATLKSLRGLQIKKLISNGLIRRSGGDEQGRNEGLNFEYYVRRNRQGSDVNNIILFGIKGPYVTGQIKLIKEAIAAKAGAMREAKTLANDAFILLIQYDDEATAQSLAKLISPKLPLNIITDTSARAQTNPYISVLYGDNKGGRWPQTKAIRVSQLENKNFVFYVRKDKERVDTTRNIFATLHGMDGGPFKNKVLIGVSPADAKYLPKKHTQALAVAIAFIRKNVPYEYKPNDVLAAMNKIQASARNQNTGILASRPKGPNNYPDKTKVPLITTLAALLDTPELKEIETLLKSDSQTILDQLRGISRRFGEISNLISYGFMKQEMLTGKTPIPTSNPIDLTKVTAFYKKYPLLTMIDTEYNLRNYGYNPGLVEALVPYLKS